MRVLAHRHIKRLMVGILLCVLAFCALAALLCAARAAHAALFLMLGALAMGAGILWLCWRYFREQDRVIERAAAQVAKCAAGEADALIGCDEEGELSRLLHEVNALVAILHAQAQREGEDKTFLRDMLLNISHQLKTPLAALAVYNGIMQEEAQGQPTMAEFLALSDQELDRINGLVQSLLKLAKLDADAVRFERSAQNVAAMMQDVQAAYAFRAQNEGKALVLAGDADVMLDCDRSWMVEALGNLVKNALDHTQAGGTVRVKWQAFPTLVQIVVSDDGSGIHPEDVPHIFKRFYRSRFSKDTQGVGLGLPLCKAVVEAHNGVIEVQSELGQGTTFTIDLLRPLDKSNKIVG